MKNNLKYLIIILFSFLIVQSSKAVEQFNFDVTEIEIIENGNKIIGSKNGKVSTDDGIEIIANKFIYEKSSNILVAKGKVKFIDSKNSYEIFADNVTYFKNNEVIKTIGNSKAIYKNGITIDANIFDFNKKLKILKASENVIINDLKKNHKIITENVTYFKNEEKIETQGNTKSYIDSKYEITSSNVNYFIDTRILTSSKQTTIVDQESQIYQLSKFNYQLEKKILKGEDMLIITNHNLPNSDKFFFKSAMINLDNREFLAKDINIEIHKDIFGKIDNDPRLKGVSSIGNNDIIEVSKGTFTSCKKNDDCPPWSISANKIVHDKIKKQLLYDRAHLKIYDIPVFYFPKFFHPDPTVKRQSGFLKPEINNSNILGNSIAVPYFREVSNDKDITFTPTLFENNMIMLENEFRKTQNNYDLLIDYGFVNNYNSPTTNKKKKLSHLFTKFHRDLNLDEFDTSELTLSIEKVTNDTYLKVFDQHITKSEVRPDDLNKLNNHIKLILTNEKFDFESGIETYENLQVNKSDRYQYVLPYYNFNAEIFQNKYDGTFNFISTGNNTLQDTNSLKSIIVNDLNFSSKDYFSELGFKVSYDLNFKNLNSIGKKVNNYKSSPQVELVSLFNIDTSIPLIKKNENYTNYFTPKISFKLNPSDMKDYSTSSNKIDVGNIFADNRLGLNDTFEAGRSLTLGLDFRKEKNYNLNDINRYFELKLATVLRDKEENLIPKQSTINRKSSNLFGSITNNISENVNINYNFALDNDYKRFEFNNLNATLSFGNLITKHSFIEENGEMGDGNVLENEITYKLNEDNFISFNTRRNRKLNLTEYYDLVYEYKNDCLTAGIKYKKSYYEDRDLKPTENLLFTISLFPLTTYEHDAKELFN